VVHAFLFPSYVLAAFAAGAHPIALVAGVRSIGVGREGRWPFSWLDSLGLKSAASVVVNAEAVREALCRRHPEVRPKVDVLANGIDPGGFRSPDRDRVRAELGLPGDAPFVLTVANLLGYKRHQDSVQAIARLRQRLPMVVLGLAGEGPLESQLRSLVAEMGLEKAVLFLGRRLDVPRLLAAADVVLLASKEEGMPNALLEAMAAGRPVVAARAGGVPELVSQGATGLMVEPGDVEGIALALERVLTDEALSRRLREAGPKLIAERFPWAKTVDAHEQLYASLHAAPGGRR
jgi:glycosyltransferase involved in cell wall biosynthesis